MAIRIIKQKALSWINIDQVDQSVLDYLKNQYAFHHLDIEDIQSESQTPKLDAYKQYLFITLQLPQWSGALHRVKPYGLNIFVGDNYLITIQREKNKEMKRFFYRCMKNKKIREEWMEQNSGFLLYHLLEAVFHDSRKILDAMGKRISLVEETVFASEPNSDVIRELAMHRRNVLSFRRIIDPERYLIATLSHTRRTFLDESLSLYFDDIGDYLNKIWVILDSYKDTVDGLHATLESLMNRRINKVIQTLTAISVSLLPLTLLSGIYGMNIPLPFSERPHIVWALFGMFAVMILITIWLMRRRRLL